MRHIARRLAGGIAEYIVAFWQARAIFGGISATAYHVGWMDGTEGGADWGRGIFPTVRLMGLGVRPLFQLIY